MSRDKLFLIEPGFADPNRPGEVFVCPYCNAIEGLLASFPQFATSIDIERVPFARPREKVIEVVGETNQGLPVLVLGDNVPDDATHHDGVAFVSSTGRILDLLTDRHGFPRIHN
ncbi:DUF3088 domain-containing protein [Phyllobacterium myrsinacearum]|uniref:Glutaredoxin n=1 Tax=Phyllobacterium myrsinacearum TaxID=28101 RepID=A0A839ERB3_9HYPH|nr:DUF3088 domain-containing protein [Phyllobacterium myrsinacearum]MBA8880044.1 glutaredoxin [Phyllobacterium myrsinacearum]